MSEWLKKGGIVMLAAWLLAGCGGSGSSSAPPTPTGPVAASVELISDLVTLRSSGADTAILTAIVKDVNNVVIAGATVNFATTSGGGSLAVAQPLTDATGQAKATLSTPNNPENRIITVTATVSGTAITDTLLISVTGTQLILTAPSSMASGDSANLTLALRDADGVGIGNQTIIMTSARANGFVPASPITGVTGNATVAYTATNGGSETITATTLNGTVVATAAFTISSESFVLSKTAPAGDIPLGSSGTVQLTWTSAGVGVVGNVTFTTTRGTVDGLATVTKATNASGVATIAVAATNAGPAVITAVATGGPTGQLSIEFIATTPTAITVDASPTSIGPGGKQSTINAVVRDSTGNLVKNQTVIFTLDDTTGGSIFPASSVTDSSGLASTVYTSSNTASAQNGVRITGTVSGTAISDVATLTVAQTSLFISIGTGNSIQEPDSASYIKEFIVFITDANGVARPNQSFIASVVPRPNDGTANPDPGIADKAAYMKGVFVAGVTHWQPAYVSYCRNEDSDLDGVLDSGEDYNADGLLTPGNQVALDASSSFVTNAAGFATIKLRYAQQYAYWMQVRIRIAATVSGTESFADQYYVLEGLAADYVIATAPPGRVYPGFVGSPFGRSATCTDIN